ncbi:hypothetical protein LP7551_02056 [Roseibium album]|nr:hypothetical protein LP7551_02056 [Roseibium album]
MTTYSSGTVSVSNGNATVTGASTAWVNAIVEGDLFSLTLDGPRYEVIAVNSDTSITLDKPYAEATQTGQAYTILRISLSRQAPIYLATQVQNLINEFKLNPIIMGGSVDDSVIGANTPAAGTFTALVAATAALTAVTIGGGTIAGAAITGGTIAGSAITGGAISGVTIDATEIGGTTAAAGTFTDLVATGGALNGVAIGSTTAAAGNFTTVNTTGSVTITNTTPSVILNETDGTSTHSESHLKHLSDSFRLRTYNSAGVFVADDLVVAKGPSGATSFNFKIAGTAVFNIDDERLDLSAIDIRVDNNKKILAGSAEQAKYYHSGSNGYLVSDVGALFLDADAGSSYVYLRSVDSLSARNTGVRVGGATTTVNLYNGGDLAAYTHSSGLTVTHGSAPRLRVNDETGTATAVNALLEFQTDGTMAGRVGFTGGDDLLVENASVAGHIYNDVENSGGVFFFRVAGTEIGRWYYDGLRIADDKKIRVGTSSDLVLYFSGSHSYIDNNTGNYYIRQKVNSGYGYLQADNNNGDVRTCIIWGGPTPNVGLRHDSATKLSTTSVGISITGTLTATGAYSSTTSSAANVNVSSAGLLRRSTSIAEAKDIQSGNRLIDLMAIVMGANPILYKSKIKGDDPNQLHWGLVAEEVAELDRALVHWQEGDYSEVTRTVPGEMVPVLDGDGNRIFDEDGNAVMEPGPERTETVLEYASFDILKPAGVQYERFVVPLIAITQHHQRAIETLSAAVGAITDPLGDTLTIAHVAVERDRRLSEGFDFDFVDERGVHTIGTSPRDMRGWDEVTTGAHAAIALGAPDTEFEIVTDTGPVTITAREWMMVLAAATQNRQPIWKSFFAFDANSIPEKYADDSNWLQPTA